jgi:hypothetical protein
LAKEKTTKELRSEVNKLMGVRSVCKKAPRKPQIIPDAHYPIRFKALGKTKGGKQGVAGWRQQYHRPFDVELAPTKIIRIEYPDDKEKTERNS